MTDISADIARIDQAAEAVPGGTASVADYVALLKPRVMSLVVFTGAVGLAVEAAAAPTSTIPILGASASIAGIIGAAARRDPHARILVVVPTRGLRLRRFAIPLLPLVAVWLVIQVAGLAFDRGEPVAFLAHATGFVVGVLMAGKTRRGLRPVD